jgi:hypothetical protein
MSTIVDLRSVKVTASSSRPSSLDVVIARLAREHDTHEAGVLPCYLCLHGVPRRTAALPKAA